jgi:hypothetical protein
MTAQIGESILYNGEEYSMASEPLNQYLQTRNDIELVSNSSACWRGYYGDWEILDDKLYLIGLKAYIKGYREVGINYFFPQKQTVFANWFSGEIRIPKGEMLDYVHLGYASLYEKDLFLVFKNGKLISKYEIDNFDEYQERMIKKEKEKRERYIKEVKKKRNEKYFTIAAIFLTVLIFIGLFFGVLYLIELGTVFAYIVSTTILCGIISTLGGVVFYWLNNKKGKDNGDKSVAFVAINLLSLVFIGLCVGIFYLIKLGTIWAYATTSIIVGSLIFLLFVAIKNRIENNKFK